MTSPVVARRALGAALVVLVVLHVYPPITGTPDDDLIGGFLPWDLAYPLLWMAAAAVLVLFMTGAPWPSEPPPERQPPLPSSPRAEEP